MYQYPSGGLNQSEMIDHIKFITKDLFQEDKHQTFPAKYLFQNQKSTFEGHKLQEYCHEKEQSIDLITGHPQYPATQQKKKKKMPIFQSIQELLPTNKRRSQKQHQPIIQKINQRVYSKWEHQNSSIREIRHKYNDRQQQRQTNEQIWSNFLKRESEWLKDKKIVNQRMKLVECDRRDSLSKSRSKKVQYDSTQNKTVSKCLDEVQQSIVRLKNDTLELKLKILSMNNNRSFSKEEETNSTKKLQNIKK